MYRCYSMEFSSKWRKFIKCCRNIQTNTFYLQGDVKYRGIGILETGFCFYIGQTVDYLSREVYTINRLEFIRATS